MTRKLCDQGLDALEQRFQALQDQVGAMPEPCREELKIALHELSQAIGALRAAPAGEPPEDLAALSLAGFPGQSATGQPPGASPGPCDTILQHLFNAIPDLLTVHDRDFNTIMSNWHGYESVPEAERQGQPKCYRVYHRRDRPCEDCHALEVLATGQPASLEKVNPVHGRVRQVSAYPIRDESGRVVLVVEHVRDITERHLAEQALKESEERFRMLFAYAPDAYFLMDLQGNFLVVNRGIEELTGYGRQELIGRNYQALPFFDDRQNSMVAALIEQAVNGEMLGPVELLLNRKDGGKVIIEAKGLPLISKGASLLLGIARDITARKQAEEALRESEATLRTLIEANPESLFLLDTRGVILAASKVAAQRLDKSLEEIIGADAFALIPPEVGQKRFEIFQQVVATGQPRRFEDVRKDFHFDVYMTPIFDQDKVVQVAVLGVDITSRKQAEEELFKHHLELQETAQRLEQSMNIQQLILESIPVRVFWKDRDLRYLGCNTLFARDAGFDHPQQLLGQDDFAMGWRDQADLYRTDDHQVMESLRPKMDIIEPQTTPDGGKIWLKTSKVPLQMPNGEVFGVLGVYEDVTDYKLAEEALAEQRELMDYVIRHDPNAIAVYDNELRYVFVSERYLNDYGIQDKDVIGKHHYEVFPEMPQRWKEVHQRVLAGAVERAEDDYFERPDGSITYNRWECRPWYRADGRIGGMITYTEVTTERKLAEMALRQSEELYRSLFENMLNGFAYHRMLFEQNRPQDYIFLNVNSSFEALTGLKDVVGKKVTEVIPGIRESDPELFETYGRVALTGISERFETYVEAMNMWFSISVYSPEKEYFVTVFDDITARKQAEAALRESEQRFRDIIENAAEWVWEVDPQGKYTYSSPVVEQLLGYKPDEILGKYFYDFFPPDEREALKNAALAAFAAKQPFRDFHNPNLHKNGQVVWLSTSGIPILDEQKNLLGYRGADIDITERREAEALSRNLIASSPVGIYLIQKRKFQLVNQWFFTITGYSKDEFLNLEPLDLVHPEDREATRENAVKMLKGLSSVPYEYRSIIKGGETKWIMETLTSIQYQGKRAVLGYFMDITQRKALEAQLLQAQKMEAVGRLAGGVAHDFNNLLMAITGYGELMRAKVLKDDPLYGHLENILKAGDRAAALTQQLLTFSRRQIVHPQVIDLNRVVLDLEPMLRRLIGEDLDLEVVTDRKLGAVKADPGQLGQIIMNLVVNARDAMPQGGRLTLKTAAVDFRVGCQSRFGLAPPGPYVMLVVQDTGVGMDEATQTHVFEPFFTTKEPGKGTGLGLSTVYGIVNQSGGYLDLESKPGAGSTFTIYLPRLDQVVEPPQVKIPITASFRGEETVLLVEDEEVLRGLLVKFLRFYGYTVLEASHGGEALLTCERHQGPIHLMVTDVVMPQMSGRELADRLTPLRPEMKILYMSGYTEDALVQHGVADLSAAFLQKPFKPIELARRVHAVLHPPANR